ncbi:hypothetical protein HRbin27_01222 [bacterium HR27]|nr:hypothetical protein HRbin27_01222 [bacterium HR27]
MEFETRPLEVLDRVFLPIARVHLAELRTDRQPETGQSTVLLPVSQKCATDDEASFRERALVGSGLLRWWLRSEAPLPQCPASEVGELHLVRSTAELRPVLEAGTLEELDETPAAPERFGERVAEGSQSAVFFPVAAERPAQGVPGFRKIAHARIVRRCDAARRQGVWSGQTLVDQKSWLARPGDGLTSIDLVGIEQAHESPVGVPVAGAEVLELEPEDALDLRCLLPQERVDLTKKLRLSEFGWCRVEHASR